MATADQRELEANDTSEPEAPSLLDRVVEMTAAKEDVKRLGREVTECREAIAKEDDHISAAWMEAATLQQIIASMPKDMVTALTRMQNNPRFFDTDRPNSKNNKPYSTAEVCQVAAQALLAGYKLVGNEWNIIAGKLYEALNGLERKVKEFPGVTECGSIRTGVPDSHPKGALVPVAAEWKLNGVAQRMDWNEGGDMDTRICVRVNDGMGTDAILGKAKRKAFKQILEKLQGQPIATDDGEPIESIPIDSGSDFDLGEAVEETHAQFERCTTLLAVKELCKALLDCAQDEVKPPALDLFMGTIRMQALNRADAIKDGRGSGSNEDK